ncbi:MAG: hypothetical protein GY719_00650 [bacterium]|nr:hypothetical protein [bacterium]
MTKKRFGDWRWVALVLMALLGLRLHAADPAVEIDVTEGEVDGRTGVGFWPVLGVEAQKPLPPEDLVVRLVAGTDRERVLEKPAGEWFVLPADKYKFWLEGRHLITPYSSLLSHSDLPFRGKGIAALVPVEAAGTVVLDPETAASSSMILRLLHLNSHNRAPYPQREFSRPVSGADLETGVLMPVGPVVAALVDKETQSYIALSRPVEVTEATASTVRPTAPSVSETDLLVRLQREEYLNSHDQDDVELVVMGEDGEPRSPDVVVSPADRIYAIWYGLDEKRVVLEAASKSVFLSPKTIVLRPGKVESHTDVLRALPDVDARIQLPPSVPLENLKLELLLDEPGKTKVRSVDLPAGTDSVTLEKVPAKRMDVVLHVPPWIFHQPVDVSDGQDGSVYFEPEVITVTGTVYRGGRKHPATLEFQTTRRGDTLAVQTGKHGTYEVALFRPGAYVVSVQLDEVKGPPYVELLEELILEDTVLDFRIPHTDFVVRVVDEETREGIAGALVMAGNRFLSRAGLLRGEEKERAATRRITTNEDGYGVMQPLHPGTLTLVAEADRYLPSDVHEDRVEEWQRERQITIELQAVKDGASLRVLLPTGAPAVNAEVRIQSSLNNGPAAWSGVADADGVIELPHKDGEIFVLVRHHEAGFIFRRLNAYDGEETWSLPPREPLSVVVKRPWGQAASGAQLALWIDGTYLAGDTLRWLAGTSPGADLDGFWRAIHIPAGPLKILAWSWSANKDLDTAQLESLAASIAYPWESPVEIETVN